MHYYFSFLFLSVIQSAIAQPANTADSLPEKKTGRIYFKPTVFFREFSSAYAPVLRIQPGDTINTESVDAVGYDKTGTKLTERGNPLTGPFYIEGASAGDIVAVTITRLALNRNYATTLEALVPRSLPKSIIKRTWREAKLVKWDLDLEAKTGSPVHGHEHLKSFKVPLKPFLGCVGVAPQGNKGVSTSDSGPFGGNMDFKHVTESATVYLPVFHDGALLYLGDGHAVQGDGELNGDALETSMDFEFTVKLLKSGTMNLVHPRVEDPEYIMAFGIGKTLDAALINATSNLLDWLQKDYQLTYKEATQVIGPGVEYRIPKIAATKVEIVAMLRKEILHGLKKQE